MPITIKARSSTQITLQGHIEYSFYAIWPQTAIRFIIGVWKGFCYYMILASKWNFTSRYYISKKIDLLIETEKALQKKNTVQCEDLVSEVEGYSKKFVGKNHPNFPFTWIFRP